MAESCCDQDRSTANLPSRPTRPQRGVGAAASDQEMARNLAALRLWVDVSLSLSRLHGYR